MDKPSPDYDHPPNEPEPPEEDDFEGLVAFYERTGAMAVNTIGPPIDRPIIPRRRPDRLGDFRFIPADDASVAPTEAKKAEDPEAKQVQEEFLDLLDKRLRRS